MNHNLLDVAVWLPGADLPCFQDALYAVAGASSATGKPLHELPADLAYFSNDVLKDPDHRICLLDTLTRFSAAGDVKNKFSGSTT